MNNKVFKTFSYLTDTVEGCHEDLTRFTNGNKTNRFKPIRICNYNDNCIFSRDIKKSEYKTPFIYLINFLIYDKIIIIII